MVSTTDADRTEKLGIALPKSLLHTQLITSVETFQEAHSLEWQPKLSKRKQKVIGHV
jgi:hypothetical protein